MKVLRSILALAVPDSCRRRGSSGPFAILEFLEWTKDRIGTAM
jgi:hypothetical protein